MSQAGSSEARPTNRMNQTSVNDYAEHRALIKTANMQRIPTCVLLWPTTLLSLFASLVITWLTWECLVPGRAFQCRDDGFDSGFWVSAETHRSAGDSILPGWTWENVQRVNGDYKLAFVAIWLSASFVSFRFARSMLEQGP